MHPGIRIGQFSQFDVMITPEMRAHFAEVTVHNLYATAAMLTHMEWAARQHLLSVLADGEEGVGAQMEIVHLAPAPIGATVTIRATVTGLLPTRVICRCDAYLGTRHLGQARVVQAVLPVAALHEKIAAFEISPHSTREQAKEPLL